MTGLRHAPKHVSETARPALDRQKSRAITHALSADHQARPDAAPRGNPVRSDLPR